MTRVFRNHHSAGPKGSCRCRLRGLELVEGICGVGRQIRRSEPDRHRRRRHRQEIWAILLWRKLPASGLRIGKLVCRTRTLSYRKILGHPAKASSGSTPQVFIKPLVALLINHPLSGKRVELMQVSESPHTLRQLRPSANPTNVVAQGKILTRPTHLKRHRDPSDKHSREVSRREALECARGAEARLPR